MNRDGQSVLEVIIAMAIFGLIASAMASMAVGGFVSLEQGGEHTEAEALAQEAIDGVRGIRDRAWNESVYATSSISVSGGQWIFDGEGTIEVIGQFTRTITYEDVCRDGGGAVVACPGAYTDAETRLVYVSVSWETRPGVTNEVERYTFVTNWDSTDWTQTDWSGGDGQSIWSDSSQYESDDGNINVSTSGEAKLISSGAGCGSQIYPFTTPGNYSYDSADIEVTGGVAQLVSTSTGPGASGDTTNPDFDTDAAGWVYADWEQSGGTSNTGSHVASGGNPTGYVNIAVQGKKSQTQSGYWEQSFTTTESNPSIATTTFDWLVSQYDGTKLNSFQLYVYVDAASGAPTAGTEVWASGEITGATGWASMSDIDISASLGAAGTYYLKIAARTINAGGGGGGPGTNIVGYDNVSLHWEGVGGGSSYPTDEPTIEPNSSFSPSSVDTWTSFAETATKNGGEIYYQLSDDDGSTWQYWNGSGWASAGAANYNTATAINTNIAEFSTSTGQILFKAFLESDGSQLVQLDQVELNCGRKRAYPFTTPGNYSYDSADIEVTGGVAQLVSTSTGPGASGDTTNPDFDTDAAGWVYADWEQSGGTSNTGSHVASGGNPTGYVNIAVQGKKSQTQSGYWEQSFTTTESNPSIATTTFDWLVSQYDGTKLNSFQLYVYVDAASGAPTAGTEVWASGEITGATGWASMSDIDISASLGAAGTYYLKIAARTINAGGGGGGPGTNIVGYDNVSLHWEGVGGGSSYPTDEPTIEPNSSFSPSSVDTWTSFAETATKNGGEIYYQLSDDDGSTWQYWNGSGWASAGAANYNTATAINTNIAEFSTSTGQILFKAFLESDGSQLVQLDHIIIGYGEQAGGGGGGGFASSGFLISSAFDMGDSSPVQVVKWNQTVPACSPTCSIQLQVRSAPDSGGSPGTWTSWYGSGGAGTYFTVATGTIASTDLNDNQWVQYRAEFVGDGSDTPVLEDVTVNYK